MSAGKHARKYLAGCTIPLMLILGQVTSPAAKEFTVNSNSDINNLEAGNGLCVAYLLIFPPFVLPFCTLRAAIEEANALPGPDTINIPSGNYPLDIPGRNEDKAATGDLDITDTLRIRGKGTAQTSVDGNALDRVFDIPNPGTQVTMANLTITGGILPPLLNTIHKGGGGIRNRGNLILRNAVLAENLVQGSAPGDAGGGILNISTCTIAESTVRGNHAFTGGGIYNGPGALLTVSAGTINNNHSFSGGGMANEGTARIENTTISGNYNIQTGMYPYGGGIYNGYELEILQSTLTRNSSQGPGGGLSNEGSIQITNTIIAGNSSTNCLLTRPVDSLGSNLDDDNSCLLDTASDIIGIDPRLDHLQDHGGPTHTHGLLIGSPAVDRGLNLESIGITTDQRGISRPVGDAFDIGAFETKKRSVVPLFTPLLCCDK